MPTKEGKKPVKSTRDICSPSTQNGQDTNDGFPNPQASHGDLNVAQLMQQMSDAAKSRRESKRSTLMQQHSAKVEEIRTQITRANEEYASKVHINRKAQVEKLSKLVEQKHNIEAEIVTSLQTVDQARAEIAQQFTIVLKGRVEELE